MRRPPRSTLSSSSAASDVYKRQTAFLQRAIDLSAAAMQRGDHPFGALIVARPVKLPASSETQDTEAADTPPARIVVEAMNSVHTGNDPTGHAETNAIRQLGAFFAREKKASAGSSAESQQWAAATAAMDQVCAAADNGDLQLATPAALKGFEVRFEMFTSTEPCIMCCGAIYWSFAMHRVVFGCPETVLAKYATDDFLCPAQETLARGKHQEIAVEGPFLAEEAAKLHAEYWPRVLGGN
eukprot:TRINITY_DN45580_c0_g1_i1.p1 TRINITY_DN45580_c0_g1~~TRINITY_DN45580_c0_g1_i1.p1  ORF type:complete len:240 (+),score=57.21 TRINITY_DN45580_c0_g1_i1:52-771(+)